MPPILENMVGNGVKIRKKFLDLAADLPPAIKPELSALYRATFLDWGLQAFRREDFREARLRLRDLIRECGPRPMVTAYWAATYLPPAVIASARGLKAQTGRR